MILHNNSAKPIYVQISEWLETEILCGNVKSNEKIYSQYQLAEMLNINPATAAKGLNLLAEANILYKKRGLGMFVTLEANELILMKRKDHTLKQLVLEVVAEAKHLHVNKDELILMVEKIYSQGEGEA